MDLKIYAKKRLTCKELSKIDFSCRIALSVYIEGDNWLYIKGGIKLMKKLPIIINIVPIVPKSCERFNNRNIIGENKYKWKSAAKYQVWFAHLLKKIKFSSVLLLY